MKVTLATIEHLDELSHLFDRYRIFYRQPSNLEAAKLFLQERFHHDDSVIFTASEDNCIVGFVQLYPSFSSVAMKRVWILNDLFVQENYRRKGVARLLLESAEKYARDIQAVRIVLATQISNLAAQALYESLGYCKDNSFYHYSLPL